MFTGFDWSKFDLFKLPDDENQENKEKTKKVIEDGCPKCGHPGDFVRMALCCPSHGFFAGC